MSIKKNLTVIMILLLMASCDEKNEDTYYRRWVDIRYVHEYPSENSQSIISINENNSDDHNFYDSRILELKKNKMIIYTRFGTQIQDIEIKGNELKTDTTTYSIKIINGDLVLSNIYDENNHLTMYYKKFNGTIPYEVWLAPLPLDKNEPNDWYSSATVLPISKTKNYNTYTGDSDFFKFDAKQGKTYIIRVNGKLDFALALYSEDRGFIKTGRNVREHPEIPYTATSGILWECQNSGPYYFEVRSSWTKSYYTTHVYEK